MNNLKKVTAAALALTCVLGMTACDDEQPSAPNNSAAGTGGTTSQTSVSASMLDEEDRNAVIENSALEIEKLENPTVKFLANFYLNPQKEGSAMPVDLDMFRTQYGGVIEEIFVPFDSRYEKLAALVASDESPDMFSAGDNDCFPRGAITKMFQPLDDYIDFDSELWAPMKEVNDLFTFDGKHYVGATSSDTDVVMFYNKKTIEDNDLADPAQLLAEDNWTWDTFWDMMIKFCDRDQSKFATDGWWFESAFSQTTGLPYIGMKDGKVVHNFDTPQIERAQEFMYNMKINDLPFPKSEYGWQIIPSNIKGGTTLFYPVGIYALTEPDEHLSQFGENMEDIMFVPLPRDPNADAYYLPARVNGMALCKGAKNPKGVAAYLNCGMACVDNPAATEISRKQYVEEYGITDEMFEMRDTIRKMTAEHPVIEFYNAVTPTTADLVNNPMKESYNAGASWTQTRETIRAAVQGELDDANKKLAEQDQ